MKMMGMTPAFFLHCELVNGQDPMDYGLLYKDRMRLVDKEYTLRPFYGSRRMTVWLRGQGIEALYPKPKLSQPGEGHKIYLYTCRGTSP
jgi:hypothetical protein